MICVICDREIPVEHGWDGGHNAEPVRKGRCCTECNVLVVIPARIQGLRSKLTPPKPSGQ